LTTPRACRTFAAIMASITARVCDDIDWDSWNPKIHATLLFIIHEGRVLLMEKKRGLGAGKINGPGGKVDPGETGMECAIRETQEELHVTAHDPEPAGELRFQFIDGLSIRCHVFRATKFSGTPTETEEGKPFWCDLDAIPYERMWQDDFHWLPIVLGGGSFLGEFIFDGDTMLDHRMEIR
jgi:8-oxo-dGTP diphosphatase